MNLPELWTGTTSERAQLAIETRLNDKKRSGKKLTPAEQAMWTLAHGSNRRLVLRRLGIGGLGLAALGAGSLGVYRNLPEQDPVEIIKDEIKKRGILTSNYERGLIKELNFWEPARREIVTDADKKETEDRLRTGFALVERSDNPIFRRTWNTFNSFLSQGRLSFEIDQKTVDSRELLATVPYPLGDRVGFSLKINGRRILRESTTLLIAAYTAHEIEHVRSLSSYMDSFGTSLTPLQRLNNLARNKRTLDEMLKEEARAYAVQCEAIIWELGLAYDGPVNKEVLDTVSIYIQSGSKNDDPRWLDYIKRTLL